ncbi:hypothetical protein CFC21_058815, partial [Triticum aestivum]
RRRGEAAGELGEPVRGQGEAGAAPQGRALRVRGGATRATCSSAPTPSTRRCRCSSTAASPSASPGSSCSTSTRPSVAPARPSSPPTPASAPPPASGPPSWTTSCWRRGG